MEFMNRPRLTLALSLYDRHFPFFDGTVDVRTSIFKCWL